MGFQYIDPHPIFPNRPRRTTIWFENWNIQLKNRHISYDVEVISAAETWLDGKTLIFLSGLQKLEQRAKKCIELRGEYVE